MRRVIWFLVVGELFVIAGDVTVVTVWYTGFVLLRWAIGPFLLGLKLQVEFLILNSLTRMGKESAELRIISITTPDEESVVVTQAPTRKQLAAEASTPLPNEHELVVQKNRGRIGIEAGS